MTLKCDRCGRGYRAKRYLLPQWCDECDRYESDKKKRMDEQWARTKGQEQRRDAEARRRS